MGCNGQLCVCMHWNLGSFCMGSEYSRSTLSLSFSHYLCQLFDFCPIHIAVQKSVAKLKFWTCTEQWLKKYFRTSNGTFVKKIHTIHQFNQDLWYNFSHTIYFECVNFMSTPNDRFVGKLFMAILFTLMVFFFSTKKFAFYFKKCNFVFVS